MTKPKNRKLNPEKAAIENLPPTRFRFPRAENIAAGRTPARKTRLCQLGLISSTYQLRKPLLLKWTLIAKVLKTLSSVSIPKQQMRRVKTQAMTCINKPWRRECRITLKHPRRWCWCQWKLTQGSCLNRLHRQTTQLCSIHQRKTSCSTWKASQSSLRAVKKAATRPPWPTIISSPNSYAVNTTRPNLLLHLSIALSSMTSNSTTFRT